MNSSGDMQAEGENPFEPSPFFATEVLHCPISAKGFFIDSPLNGGLYSLGIGDPVAYLLMHSRTTCCRPEKAVSLDIMPGIPAALILHAAEFELYNVSCQYIF